MSAYTCVVMHMLSFVGYEKIAELGEETQLEHTSARPLLWFMVVRAYIVIVIFLF